MSFGSDPAAALHCYFSHIHGAVAYLTDNAARANHKVIGSVAALLSGIDDSAREIYGSI